MNEKDTHELMNVTVDDIDSISESLFAHTDGDLLIVGVAASKEHGQMLITGPLEIRNAIGILLTVIAGAGEELEIFSTEERKLLSEVAFNLIDVH